jgi:hypothetical protein
MPFPKQRSHSIANRESPSTIDIECDAKNGFYRIDPALKKDFELALLMLETAATKVKDPIKPRVAGDCIYAELTMAMVAIERLKWDIFERLARQDLEGETGNNYKVVVGVHYLETLFELERRLSAHHPLVLHGDVEEDEREEIIEAFQGDASRRLLLCITQVGGVGISLHDTVGDAPRRAYMSPTFNLIEEHQFAGRFYRVGTQSPVHIRMVYANVGNREKSIRDCLIKKSETLRGTLEEYTRRDIILPIDYEEEWEE